MVSITTVPSTTVSAVGVSVGFRTRVTQNEGVEDDECVISGGALSESYSSRTMLSHPGPFNRYLHFIGVGLWAPPTLNMMLQMRGFWENAFGIPKFHLGNCVLGFSVIPAAPFPMPTDLVIGELPPDDAAAIFQ